MKYILFYGTIIKNNDYYKLHQTMFTFPSSLYDECIKGQHQGNRDSFENSFQVKDSEK